MTWQEDKLLAQLETVELIKDYVIVSGGLAWHIMSPPHEEEKTLHDHKDIDLFVIPEFAPLVFSILKANGFKKCWTKYDGITPNFIRFTRTELNDEDKPIKVLIDLFVETIESIEVDGWKLVEPKSLLALYEKSHSSKDCTAVVNAVQLVAKGIDPVGRMELIGKRHVEG